MEIFVILKNIYPLAKQTMYSIKQTNNLYKLLFMRVRHSGGHSFNNSGRHSVKHSVRHSVRHSFRESVTHSVRHTVVPTVRHTVRY